MPLPMFPLRCVRVRAHTSRETSAHKKTWSTHKCLFKKCVCTSFQIQVLLHRRNFMRTQTLKNQREHWPLPLGSLSFSQIRDHPFMTSTFIGCKIQFQCIH